MSQLSKNSILNGLKLVLYESSNKKSIPSKKRHYFVSRNRHELVNYRHDLKQNLLYNDDREFQSRK